MGNRAFWKSPQGRHIAALILRARRLNRQEVKTLAKAWIEVRDTTWNSARIAVRDAAWDTARDAALVSAGAGARDAAWDTMAWGAAWDAARALVVRDLVGKHGLTQDHYDTLTRPWRTIIGNIHPDDKNLKGQNDD